MYKQSWSSKNVALNDACTAQSHTLEARSGFGYARTKGKMEFNGQWTQHRSQQYGKQPSDVLHTAIPQQQEAHSSRDGKEVSHGSGPTACFFQRMPLGNIDFYMRPLKICKLSLNLRSG